MPAALLQEREAGAALVVERADLAVEDGVRACVIASAAARATSRNRSVRSLPFRLVSVTSPPDTVTIARKPSHFGSKTQPSPTGSASAAIAPASARSGRPRRRRRPCAGGASSSDRRRATPARASTRRRGAPRAAAPSGRRLCFSSRRSYVPRSQISTVPAPYSPAGIMPSKSAYSSGWSSTCTARWRSPRPQRDALRHRPARERAVALEPEVVVETPRGVPLDHEAWALAASAFPRRTAPASSRGRRLRRYSSRLTCGLSPEAQHVLYQPAARCAFSLLRRLLRGRG